MIFRTFARTTRSIGVTASPQLWNDELITQSSTSVAMPAKRTTR